MQKLLEICDQESRFFVDFQETCQKVSAAKLEKLQQKQVVDVWHFWFGPTVSLGTHCVQYILLVSLIFPVIHSLVLPLASSFKPLLKRQCLLPENDQPTDEQFNRQ